MGDFAAEEAGCRMNAFDMDSRVGAAGSPALVAKEAFPPMSQKPHRASVSIIVPVHRGGKSFERCLAAIRAQDVAPLDVIVVADGAVPEDVGTARRSGARVVELPHNGGPARARNAGAQLARGEILFFVDADVEMAQGSIARIQQIFDNDTAPAPAAAIGSYDDKPAGSTFLAQYKNLQHHYVHQTGRPEASTFWGACGAIRKEVFQSLGGFDESYSRPCIEDIELGYRLRLAGHSIRLCRDLQVKHLKVWTARSMLRADFLFRALPWTELILRQGRAANDLNLHWSSRASGLLATGAVIGLIASVARPSLLPVLPIAAAGLIGLNIGFYRFLWRRRGPWFLLRALPWHWFYYLYAMAGFGLGMVRHHLGIRRAPWRRPPARPEPLRSGEGPQPPQSPVRAPAGAPGGS
jgi:GT2 family glycosyltransferase